MILDTTDPRLEFPKGGRDLPLLFCWRCALGVTVVFADCNNPAHVEEDARERMSVEAEWHTERGCIQTTRLRYADGKGYGDLLPFFYQVNPNRTITLLQYRKGPVIPDWPYPNYPDAFPAARLSLFRLTEEVQDAMRAMNLGDDAAYLDDEDTWPEFPDLEYILGEVEWHQIGGEPWLSFGWYTMHCPICAAPMPFLAHVQNPCTDPRGFVGGRDADVHFHACEKCFVLGAYFHRN